MLQIVVPPGELYDEQHQEFLAMDKEQILQLEHSLVSLSKWESKWHKAFLGKEDKTTEEIIDYVRCMTLNKNVNPNAYRLLTKKNIEEISDYINDPMTATTFSNNNQKGHNKEILTNEIIYYYMVAFGIPSEYQKWHLNRLMTLIKVCDIKNQPQKKMSKKEIMNRNAALNAARRKQLNSKG